MMASASTEFIALCQSQVMLLTQALGAASTVVYMAEPSVDPVEPTLVPLAAYPDTAATWTGLNDVLATLAEQEGDIIPDVAVGPENLLGSADTPQVPFLSRQTSGQTYPADPQSSSTDQGMAPGAPLVLPIAHEGAILGVIVSTRDQQPWHPEDYQQAEQVAQTLAIACVMDQRGQWLQRQLTQRQLTQTNQSATFHDLLHQFRNPLTALQTFGKLMLKRMGADDPNQPIAESIVRESRRLQDLAEHFDDAVAQGDDALTAASTVPPVAGLLPSGEDMAGTTAPQEPDAVPTLGRSLMVMPGSVSEVVPPLLQSIEAMLPERDMQLVHDIPPDLPAVWLDPQALREVISNLLDNAIKYGAPGTLIWVTSGIVQTIDHELYQGIAVGDTGMGIPLGDQTHIFERHYRGVQAHGEVPGTGLGLAIVRDLVRAMGGYIDLISPVHIDHWISAELTPNASGFSRGPGTLFMVWLKTV
jgi:signal transduction histidine kinase